MNKIKDRNRRIIIRVKKKILKETELSDKKYIATYRDIKKYFKYFNKILFKDKLNSFNDIQIKRLVKASGQCVENIDYYNNKFKTNYSYLDFRRNVVTKGIELNNLVGKKLTIGNIKVEGHDLCRPCKHLEETLKGQDIIKEFLRRGGLRCEILKSGTINIADEIKVV